ncbi:hypothetical protein KQY27_05220 [Methanobrevibacter sp. TMH8]|uniref:PD-(D/E)XK nuclease domain-containing protein n=1 Tax=Methanobrevibacter sp. TMH8 TaxID=2848611 RepID=UPI001CCBABA6|nr:hypothetical protein [Methanobrevibacter sp. TMH8]MBZ9570941.1 hypothetical protein [Methanobrevibacter sp. TMH8]
MEEIFEIGEFKMVTIEKNIIDELIDEGNKIKVERSNFNAAKFLGWKARTLNYLYETLTPDNQYVKAFEKDVDVRSINGYSLLSRGIEILENISKDISKNMIGNDEEIKNIEHNPIEDVENIFNKFHELVKIFENRTHNKAPLLIEDEYDVQYLLLPLLRLYFDDIIDEESVPTQGSTRSFIDFFLKDENIAIETKITSPTLRNNALTKQLNDDIGKYSKHPEVKTLMFFIYNPGNHIKNPIGFIKDFTKKERNLDIKTYITP